MTTDDMLMIADLHRQLAEARQDLDAMTDALYIQAGATLALAERLADLYPLEAYRLRRLAAIPVGSTPRAMVENARASEHEAGMLATWIH